MKKHMTHKLLAIVLAVLLLATALPVSAATGGATVEMTPFQQFCGAYINLGGVNYLCAVDLGSPIIESASDTELTPGTTVRLELFFSINDGWYACRKHEMQGDPNEIYTVRFTKTAGGDRVTEPVWKTYPDDGYGERWYLEFTILGGETAAPIDLSIALTQPDVPNVGAEYRITGTSSAWSTCAAPFQLPGYTGYCDIYFMDPVTSTGTTELIPGDTVCFPLAFMGGDGQLYAAFSTELQGDPSELFTVEEKEMSGLTKVGWKKWDNNHWYLEYAVTATDSSALNAQVRLRQEAEYKATPWKGFAGWVPAKQVCVAPISIGGTVYDCTVDLQGNLTSTGDAQNMTADSTVCFPLMFMGGDGQWYPVLKNELQGDPAALFTLDQNLISGGELVSFVGWGSWDNGHYFAEYKIAEALVETNLEFGVQLKQDDQWRQGSWDMFTGKAPAKEAPAQNCTVPISIGGTVYDCIVDLQGYLTSTGSDTMEDGGFICFPLMFMGGDGQWYPVLKGELQGEPSELLSIVAQATAGGDNITFAGWNTWDNGHYYAAFQTTASEAEVALDFTVQLTGGENQAGTPIHFAGTIPGKPTHCMAPINLGGTVYDCIVDLQGYLTSTGSDTMDDGGFICFPLMFMGGDGVWYPVLKGELQGEPAELFSVVAQATAGGDNITFSGWGNWDNGHYYAAYQTQAADEAVTLTFAAQLQQGQCLGQPSNFNGIIAGKAVTPDPDPDPDPDPEPETPEYCIVPIKIGGVVYDCYVNLQGYLTSSGSDTLTGGGTVAFPLMFMGGDGVWYPVLKHELQGNPADFLKVGYSVTSGKKQVTFQGWGNWDNGHYYAEFGVKPLEEDTTVTFTAWAKQGSVKGSSVKFSGKVPGQPGASDTPTDTPTDKPEAPPSSYSYPSVPIKIGDTVYDCYVDLVSALTSSGSTVLPSGGTIAFPLMFMGGDGVWYPVLKGELQGEPAELFDHTLQATAGGDMLTFLGWGNWESGHYYLEYKVVNTAQEQPVEFTVQLTRDEVPGSVVPFSGLVEQAPDISSLQIPMKPSASLVVERLEECADFNTMSFTIADVRYNDQWPIDFESPNTTTAVITDGTIIRADLCFKVNGQWYPVRQQECNESVEELYTYDYQVLSGEDFLTVPRFTTRYDQYGDIWQFEVGISSEEEGEFSFTLQLVSKDGLKKGSKYQVTGRVQNGQISSTVEEIPEDVNYLPWILGGGAAVLVVAALVILLVVLKKKKK